MRVVVHVQCCTLLHACVHNYMHVRVHNYMHVRVHNYICKLRGTRCQLPLTCILTITDFFFPLISVSVGGTVCKDLLFRFI